MYPKAGGKEYPESASLGVLILWTTWLVLYNEYVCYYLILNYLRLIYAQF